MVLSDLLNCIQKGKWAFVLMIAVLIIAVYSDYSYTNRAFRPGDMERFNKVLHIKEQKTESALRQICERITDDAGNTVNDELIEEYAPYYMDEGILFFVYELDSLIIWTSNAIPVPSSLQLVKEPGFFKLSNSWVLRKSITHNDYTFTGLIVIRSEYPYENRVLKGEFQESFKLPDEVEIDFPNDTSVNPVFSKEGEYLFSLDFTMAKRDNVGGFLITLLLYVLVFFLVLYFLRKFLHNAPGDMKNYLFIAVTLILISFYVLLHYFRIPEFIFSLEIFSPGKFARSPFLPSLGDLLLLTISGFFVVYNFYLDVYFDPSKLNKYRFYRITLVSLCGLIILSLFVIKTFLIRSLILDSSIAFETYKVQDISAYTFLGFLLIALVFASYALLLDKIFGILKRLNRKREALLLLTILNIVIVAIFFIPELDIFPESLVFFIVISILLYYFRIKRRTDYQFSSFVIYILLFSVFIMIEVVRFTKMKTRSDMRIIAVNLSSEHDPVAELLFVNISSKLPEDSEVRELIFGQDIDFEKIYNTIQRKYFPGYWNNYDLQITLCQPHDSVYILPPEDKWAHCYDFFYEQIMEYALQVPNTGFYFLDNRNGRISYFSPVIFRQAGREVTVFIELDSRLLSEGLGYPELLLEGKYNSLDANKVYSYAKYFRNNLIYSSGPFSYRMARDVYTDGTEGFMSIELEGFEHVIYNIDEDNTIIVTRPAVFFIDILISFSYIFGFYFFILVLILLFTGIRPLLADLHWNFKKKVQFTMSAILIFSLLLIGGGMVYYSIRQYENRNIENLREKSQSLYIELIHKLEFEKDLRNWSDQKYYNLEELLQKFSNVFFTDINLYDEYGWLLASSRPEVFNIGLKGENMDAVAYNEMIHNKRSEFIHIESIGKLKYLSAYLPFVNSENKLLAYLNIPYFTRQGELTADMTNLVVAIVNILVLLTLLTITIAVFMANAITRPLRIIQDHISRFRLNEGSEKIYYRGKDEIGSLINEYNKMIDQVIISAERLARSERESAWREMAKQVAHEIKNPLTPMRLLVQHLQRSWKEDKENREQQIEKLARTLIEQIDNLSSIATEFSNFAKMPSVQNEKINIIGIIKNVARLFENTKDITIRLDQGVYKELEIWGDKEQLSRVFINLVKNAIQSIPDGKKGLIEIEIESTMDKIVAKIKDNGKGIPEEIEGKLFQPNFTTKSSGMGMGLAIARNIVTNAGGDIYYETELNKGTIFFVTLPKLIE